MSQVKRHRAFYSIKMANTMRIFSILIVCLILAGLVLVGVVWTLPQKRPAQVQKSPSPQTTVMRRSGPF